MASFIQAINPAEQLRLLKTECETALAQQQAAEKAMASFAEYLRLNPTSENATKFRTLVQEATEANRKTCALRMKTNQAQLAYLKDTNLSASQDSAPWADSEVTELDVTGPIGYYPT